MTVFFALTRTEVGREGLRIELERQFSERFDGDLEIGTLRGNLLNRLSAGGIQIRDSSGSIVFSADSIVAHPSWRDLLERTVSTGRIRVIRPEVHLLSGPNGAWRLGSLRPKTVRSGPASPWSFSSANITVVDGRLTTRSVGDQPKFIQKGLVFDYTNGELEDVNGRAIVEWQPDMKFVDVLQLSGRVPDLSLPLNSLRGQFVIDDGGLELNAVHVRTGATRLHFSGSLSSLAALHTPDESPLVDIDLGPSTLDADELTRIFPRLPFSDEITASVHATGPLSALSLENLEVSHGSARISAAGTLNGLPDSLGYELDLQPGSISWKDVDAVYSGSNIASFEHLGSIAFSGASTGIVRFGGGERALPYWQSRTAVQTESVAGRLDTDIELALGGDPRVTVIGTLAAHDLNVGIITQNPALESNLNGRATIDGSGIDLLHSTGTATVSLAPSHFAGRSADTLRVNVTGDDGLLTGRLSASMGGGSVDAGVRARIDSESTSYVAEGVLSRFDIGSVLRGDSLASSLNVRFEVDGAGNSMEAFQGQASLDFDSSRTIFGGRERIVAPHRTSLTVRQLGSSNPIVEIGGDALALRITGDVAIDPFVTLSRYWADTVIETAQNIFAKPLRRDTVLAASSERPHRPTPLTHQQTHDQVRIGLDRAGLTSQSVQADIRVVRADILSALVPFAPPIRTNAVVRAGLTLDEQRFDLDLALSADSVQSGTMHARGFEMTVAANGSIQAEQSKSIATTFEAAASDFRFGDHEFIRPAVAASVDDRTMQLDIHSYVPGTSEPLRLSAQVDLLSDRNRVHLEEFQLSAQDQIWRADAANAIDVYEDAVVVRDVTIHRVDAGSTGRERIQIRGTLSPAPTDTLFADVHDIQIQHAAALLAVQRPIGGAINGRLAYTGFARPELTGSIDVASLSYDDRTLGSIHVESRYLPGSPDVALDARISPIEYNQSGGGIYKENDLSVDGTFRLPGFDAAGATDEGALDLRLSIDKLDAFFFEYIFAEEIADVRGFFEGDGRIGGTFSRPIFNVDVETETAGFHIPEFDLTYDLAGAVRVNEEGIHLDDVVVTDAVDGGAVVFGSILFNEYRYFSFDLRGDLDDLRIMNVDQSRDLPFYGQIWASGHATLEGPLSNAFLEIDNAVVNPESDLYIPITESSGGIDSGFIVFADSVGRIPDIYELTTREHLLAPRPMGERPFLEGMEMNLNITVPEGSTVHLVIDPLLGDEINAVGSGNIELIRTEGEFFTYGTFDVDAGDYLFTAGEVFFRRFLIDDGSISWDGDPLNAMLDIQASYRTRASTEGLTAVGESRLIPLIIHMKVFGRVATPNVELSLAVNRDDRRILGGYEGLESELNQPELTAQFATSVLLTNSFLLTTSALGSQQSVGLSDTRNQLAFNSLSQLVASQLNRYLNYALPNIDLNFGVQGESAQDLDVTYGVALRLLDERLIIRGQGIYRNETTDSRRQQSGLDEFVVEVRLNPNVSVEAFYRREGDLLSATESFNTSTGAGVSYQTQFTSWDRFVRRLFGWLLPNEVEVEGDSEDDGREDPEDERERDEEEDGTPEADVVAGAAK